MTRLRALPAIGLLSLAAAASSCGDVVRQGRSPVYLVIDQLTGVRGGPNSSSSVSNTLASDVITNVTSPAPCTTDRPCPTIFADGGQVQLRVEAKNITSPSGPSPNNDVTITRYHVAYRRADGRNIQGVDVPWAFDGAITGTVPAGGTRTLSFVLVRNVAKEESPLVQLVTSATIITTIAEVTFFGHDQVGNDISISGSIQIDFGNFGDQ